ncbi:MAG TPA: hypothetical protein VEU55_03290 [Gemmatimonadales bacterium]|nr:hypothetical protein [Gemmatimonadales bacterium]
MSAMGLRVWRAASWGDARGRARAGGGRGWWRWFGCWAAVVSVGCGAGAGWDPPSLSDDNPAAVFKRRISGREAYADITRMPRAFRRPTDPYVGPAYLFFADNGRLACLVSDREFASAVEGAFWMCRWREPR